MSRYPGAKVSRFHRPGRFAAAFEVWVNGAERRVVWAQSQTFDGHAQRRSAWLKLKLEALAKARDEQGFALRCGNSVALAKRGGLRLSPISCAGCEQLAVSRIRATTGPLPTPGCERTVFAQERNRSARTMKLDGGCHHANTGRDFVLGVKERTARRRSRYSIWLGGYPKALEDCAS